MQQIKLLNHHGLLRTLLNRVLPYIKLDKPWTDLETSIEYNSKSFTIKINKQCLNYTITAPNVLFPINDGDILSTVKWQPGQICSDDVTFIQQAFPDAQVKVYYHAMTNTGPKNIWLNLMSDDRKFDIFLCPALPLPDATEWIT